MPIKFSRVTIQINELTGQGAQSEGGNQAMKAIEDDGCRYLDQLEEGGDRTEALEEADQIDVEEDEEYRVRSTVITAISCIRAKDGMTPPGALTFLEEVLEAVDAEAAPAWTTIGDWPWANLRWAWTRGRLKEHTMLIKGMEIGTMLSKLSHQQKLLTFRPKHRMALPC